MLLNACSNNQIAHQFYLFVKIIFLADWTSEMQYTRN